MRLQRQQVDVSISRDEARQRNKERNLFATNNINIKQEKHNIKVSS